MPSDATFPQARIALPTGVVTFVFTDVEGSAALWAKSPLAMGRSLAAHDRLLRSAFDDAGGLVFSRLGEGFGVAFQSPRTAVNASLEIQETLRAHSWSDGPAIRVRIGLHLGEAIERGSDYFGPAVNLAARVTAAGHGGQVLASGALTDLIGSDTAVHRRDLGQHRLKGIAEPLNIWQFSRHGDHGAFPELRVERKPLPAGRGVAPELVVERDVEQAVLEVQLTGLQRGSGGLVTVSGEAGAGKSTLLALFEQRCAEREVSVARGCCDPLSTARTLGAWRDIAADPVTRLGNTFASGRDQVDVVEDLLAALRRVDNPLAIVIEDLHWADDATLAVLRFLAPRLHGLGVLIVASIRTEDGAHATEVLADAMAGPGNHQLELSPLSERAVAQLLEGSDLDPGVVYRMTSGNPFFVSEVLASEEDIPPSIRASVIHRLRNLSVPAQRLIEVVSAAPRALDFDDISSLTQASAADIDVAVRAGLLVLDNFALRFRHDLARTAIYHDLPLNRRLEIHALFVDHLVGMNVTDLDHIAHHAISSHDSTLIVAHVPAAAEAAAAHGSSRQAETYYVAAIEAADRQDPALAADLRNRLSAIMIRLGSEPAESLRINARVIEFAESSGETELLGRALVTRSVFFCNLPDVAGARSCMERAIDVLVPFGPSRGLFEASIHAGLVEMLDRRLSDAAAMVDRAHQVAGELGDPKLFTRVESMRAVLSISDADSAAAVRQLQSAVEGLERSGDTSQYLMALGMLGSGSGEFKLYGVAAEALEQSIAALERHDRVAAARYDRAWLARVRFETGRWSEALDLGRAMLDVGDGAAGPTLMTARSAVGRAMVRRGDVGGAELLAEVAEETDRYFLQYVWPLLCGLAEAFWLSGDISSLQSTIGPAYERALLTESVWARGETAFWMWKAGLITDAPELSAEPYALQIAGEWRAAAGCWHDIGSPYEEAMALLDGDATAREQALEILDELGAAPLAARVRAAEARDAGVDRRYERSELTKRQFEVIELIREGLDNKTIGEQLFISKKTVEHHVAAIFATLAVKSRTAAVAEANRRELFKW